VSNRLSLSHSRTGVSDRGNESWIVFPLVPIQLLVIEIAQLSDGMSLPGEHNVLTIQLLKERF
jgi:hypothetical protein